MKYDFIVYRAENGRPKLPAVRRIKLKTWKGVRENIRRCPYREVDNTPCMSYIVEQSYPNSFKVLNTQTINLGYI